MIPDIDFASTVEASSHPQWKPGDGVILNGWGAGETHLGGKRKKLLVEVTERRRAQRRSG